MRQLLFNLALYFCWIFANIWLKKQSGIAIRDMGCVFFCLVASHAKRNSATGHNTFGFCGGTSRQLGCSAFRIVSGCSRQQPDFSSFFFSVPAVSFRYFPPPFLSVQLSPCRRTWRRKLLNAWWFQVTMVIICDDLIADFKKSSVRLKTYNLKSVWCVSGSIWQV